MKQSILLVTAKIRAKPQNYQVCQVAHQNHKTARVGRDLKDYLVPCPCCGQGFQPPLVLVSLLFYTLRWVDRGCGFSQNPFLSSSLGCCLYLCLLQSLQFSVGGLLRAGNAEHRHVEGHIKQHREVWETHTMKESGCIHTGNPFPCTSGQDTPIGSHGSRGPFSICPGQGAGQRVQPG